MNANAPVTFQHLLGTDDLGRDELTRIMYGARYSLAIGMLSTFMALAAGVVMGALAGYFGGMVDNLIMRFFDVLQAIPNLLLSIIVAIVLGSIGDLVDRNGDGGTQQAEDQRYGRRSRDPYRRQTGRRFQCNGGGRGLAQFILVETKPVSSGSICFPIRSVPLR